MANFDPFEREFRQRASGLRRTPNANSWSRIERRLDHQTGIRILGIRPWMIAALLLLVAGATIITKLSEDRGNNPLAQRAEFIEELSTPYIPAERFQPVEYFNGVPDSLLEEDVPIKSDFRELVVAKKYRI